MIRTLPGFGEPGGSVLVGPETGDDAGVFLHKGEGLVATADFITPVCDDPRRFGRVAAANSISDVFAMGGEALFALNLCCFPKEVPQEALGEILLGGKQALDECGAAMLGGHTVQDKELKFGMAVIGRVDPERVLEVTGARAGDRVVLSKPVGTGVVINAFKAGKLDEATLEPVLVEMERLNAKAAELGLAHEARACTDVTGFGLSGHALNVARGSAVGIRIAFEQLPVHEAFYEGVAQGVSTGATKANRAANEGAIELGRSLSEAERELLFDPQTSGGLLLFVPSGRESALAEALVESGHRAAVVGEVLDGPARLEIV